MNLENLSFSFDKMMLLQNVNVAVNAVTKSLAKIIENIQISSRPKRVPRWGSRKPHSALVQERPNTFATLSSKTTAVDTQVYPERQLDLDLPSFDVESADDSEDAIYEPPRRKTNNVVSEKVRHKPTCTSTEKS